MTPDPLATLLDNVLDDVRDDYDTVSNQQLAGKIAARLIAAGVTLTQPQPDADYPYPPCATCGKPIFWRAYITTGEWLHSGFLNGPDKFDHVATPPRPTGDTIAAAQPSCCDDLRPHQHGSRWVPARHGPTGDAALREAAIELMHQRMADRNWRTADGIGVIVPIDALRAALRSTPATPRETPRLIEALREEQSYAYTLSEALIGLGHHAAAKHQSPDQYDSESGLACAAPSCLIALRSTPAATQPDYCDKATGCARRGGHEGPCGIDARPTGDTALRVPPRDFLPGGDGYPSWIDPLTGKDKDR